MPISKEVMLLVADRDVVKGIAATEVYPAQDHGIG
jgi:hypothetical protein